MGVIFAHCHWEFLVSCHANSYGDLRGRFKLSPFPSEGATDSWCPFRRLAREGVWVKRQSIYPAMVMVLPPTPPMECSKCGLDPEIATTTTAWQYNTASR